MVQAKSNYANKYLELQFCHVEQQNQAVFKI